MNIASTKVFALFSKYRSKKFIFIRPIGNCGDFLIFKGAEKLAQLASLKFESVSCKEFKSLSFPSDHVLYVYGNGGFNDMWSSCGHMEAFTKAVSTHPGIVILGPTTFFNDKTFLKNRVLTIFKNIRAEKVYMFSRETTDHQWLVNMMPTKVGFNLDHDTALNLERCDLMPTHKQGRGTLYAIRNDKEATNIVKFQPFLLWFDPVDSARDFHEWLYIHDGVEEIITNRLHSSIVGAILKKKVTLLPNNYHKNRGLWELSLKDLGVQWEENLVLPAWNKHLLQNKFYQRLSNSYKINRLIKTLYLNNILPNCKHHYL